MMWKILITQIKEEIYNSLECCGLFSENRNNAAKEQEIQNELLFIDQHMMK